ncbi:MAG: Ig-like domain-containing protein, partial [Treponema sp.]|nr:Ig-like domain-containing protein [Treponema sp.]
MALFLVLLASCDLLRKSPYEVEAWTPGEGFHSDPAGIRVSLLLSHESDRARTEQAFSLTEDRRTLKGDFSWDGARLFFIPAAPLEADRDYRITLGTGAQDTNGLSLEQKFEASFSTRPSGGKPRITGTEPEDGGTIPESRGEFRLFFSEPISLDSCRDYVSFSPSTPGSWRLEDENRSACFIPREPWQTGNLYRVKVEKDFAGSSGVVLGEEYSSVFFAGVDREKPVLIKVLALL